MNFRLLSDIIILQGKVVEKDFKIAELLNEIKELSNWERDMHEILDEKNKDIASLHRQLREVEENLSKLVSYKAWNIAEDLSINQVISEGYDGEKKESNNS
jgi:hypothetical protein